MSSTFAKALADINKKMPGVVKNVQNAAKVKYLHTDSPAFNYVIGGGKGIALGRIHRLMGPESGGKSTIATYAAYQFQKHLKEQLGLDKPYTVYIDFERTFDPDHAKELGLNCDEDHFVYLAPDDIESAANVLEPLVKTGEVACVIFDSESMAAPRTVMEDEVNKANFGSKAKALGNFLLRFTILCANYETTLFMISQERANTQMMSHAIVTTGGYMLKYAASTLCRVKKIDEIHKDGKFVGIHMNCRNFKNKTAIPGREKDMTLYFVSGFDSFGEYVDLCKEFQGDPRMEALVKIGGAYYKGPAFGSICGKDKFAEWAADPANEKDWSEIKAVIDEIMSKENVADAKEHDDTDVPAEYLMDEKTLAKKSAEEGVELKETEEDKVLVEEEE